MMQTKRFVIVLALILTALAVQAQQFNSVSLDHDSYRIIDLGILRGVISPPAAVRPWSESIIKEKLREMLDNQEDKLSSREIDIVSDALSSFERKSGLDFRKGRFNAETAFADQRFSIEAGLNLDSNFAVNASYPDIATVTKVGLFLAGDMSSFLSWNFAANAGFLQIDREVLGMRPDPPYVDPVYGEYDGNPNSDGHFYAYDIPNASSSKVYSYPAYFPYTFTKPWEAGVFVPDNMAGYTSWPDKFSFFYEMFGELNTSFFDNHLYLRAGRMRRDWGPEENGTSLFMNGMARPFMAFEGTAIPFNWIRFSFLTGTQEYLNKGNQWSNAEPYQNMISMTLLEIDTGRHFHLDFGTSAIYAKRLELGYLFPLISDFFYQNNIGDFDNMAIFGNLEVRFLSMKIWLSLFVDEMRPAIGDFLILDRNMYAYQGGIKSRVSWLPFGAFTLRYTKIEPYNYTHEYSQTPWHRVPMDTSYLNNGESLGFYLPPNSDELLIRMEAMPLRELKAHIQYQMIRHGADWGYRRVDGSSNWDKIVKNDNTKKYFLRDGAYEWDHVIKLGGTYTLKTIGIPMSFYAETGVVITRFTNSDAELGSEGNYSSIDNAVYRAGNHFIFSIGMKIYP